MVFFLNRKVTALSFALSVTLDLETGSKDGLRGWWSSWTVMYVYE
jgi:hypothetical protein